MATTGVKQKEGWPFFLALVGLALGTIWNAAGGNLSAFGHIGSVVWQAPPTSFEEFGLRLEQLIRLPQPPKIPPQKLIPPKEMASAEESASKLPGPRPTLAGLGDEGRHNPFLPKWAQTIAKEAEPPTVTGPDIAEFDGKGGRKPGDLGSARTKGPAMHEDTYIFNGILKMNEDPPVAIVMDAQKNLSVFLKEGDKYGPLSATKVHLYGATFQIQGVGTATFDTYHATKKTMTVRKAAPAGN